MTWDAGSPAERAAGELLAAMAREAEPAATLPASLMERIVAAGEIEVTRPAPVTTPSRPQLVRESSASAPAARGWQTLTPWLIAAAAVVAWFVVPNPRLGPSRPQPGAAVAALRDSLLNDPALVRVAWAPSTDPAGTGASGEVLWSPARQRGILRFAGLAPNDPRLAQYQLWIVDGDRDARYPVDGGVFDVSASGEVLVPVTARLPVSRPTLFAVTLEKPGGVVVSTRERLVLAAPVGG